MIDVDEIRPDDRVLSLVIPGESVIKAISAKLTHGLLVAVGPDNDVRSARRAFTDLDNVMIVPDDPSGMIPWQDAFFSVVLAPETSTHDPEVRRVLVPEGRIVPIP